MKRKGDTIRCPTGVPGFDNLCEGGFYRDSINAILGGPGSGKSTFLLQFLYNGVVEYNENGLYVSFEPFVEDIYADGMNYGWDLQSLDSEGKCRFIKVSPKITLRALRQEIMKIISQHDIRRVCIDPISVLAMSLKSEGDIREVIFDLTSLLKRMNVTVLIADETNEGSAENMSLGDGDERTQSIKFLCDGLVNLYSSGLGGETDRAIRITKMRRTPHVRGPVAFKITSKGLVVSKK